MKLFRTLLSIAFLYTLCAATVALAMSPEIFATAGLISGTIIFTAPGGVATPFSFNLTYLPEYLSYNHGANPLTSLRVETQEDGVLHDWNAAAIAAVNGFNCVGALTANDVILRLSDGELRPKNVTISGVTAAAGAIVFSGSSNNKGVIPFKSSNAAILALNPTLFENFTALFIPAMVTATDRAEITYKDGHRQTWDSLELARISTLYQQVAGVIINNSQGDIDKAEITCAAQRAAYILSVFIKGQ